MSAILFRCLEVCSRALKRLAEYTPFVVRPARWWRVHQQLVALAGEQGWEWRASGTDPQFRVRRRLLVPGWYMLEVGMKHDRSDAVVKLFLDSGRGFNDDQCVSVPLRPGKINKRLLYVRGWIKALRIDPLEAEGQFTFWHLRLAWLTPRFAHDRLSHRLVSAHQDWRGLHKADVLRTLKAQAIEQRMSLRELALRYYDATFDRRPVASSYRQWLASRRNLSAERVQQLIEELPEKPLISILVPVFNPRVRFLRACLESVLGQYYENWQLCIADDASTDREVHRILAEFAERDARVQVVYRPRNGHICAASNSALELADGELVALLDHDDCLSPYALFCVAEAMHRNPEARFIYSDEDKLDANGERYDPHFKPRWNPDLLLAQNYVSHLAVYRTSLVREVGAFREGFEGSQDHDLVLRVSECLAPEQIVHIPHVLYHWRAVKGSTALGSRAKDYTSDAGLAAVHERVPDASVRPGQYPNTYRVHWPLPEPAPLVSLLVPTRDRVEMLRPCVNAILERTDYPNLELLILDNGSRDAQTLTYLREVAARDERVRVLRWNNPFNYSAINNFGARHASGEILGLVNNDIEPINSEWLDEMVRQVIRPEIGCVGAKLYYPNDTIQHGGVILGLGGVAGHSHKHFEREAPGYFYRLHLAHNLSAVTGACLLVRKSVFDEVGGLNEGNLPVAFNDVDLCLKVREAGYRNLWTPYAELYHHESVSRGTDDNGHKRARADREIAYMRETWGKELDDDPAYSPNLTLNYEDFSLR